ncbi:MAG: GNAT family N-acetyltransferase [Candidatus Rokubacteria bacterium]|nr:GNAT family N-acetyltransferase [Candidatus Rokubacteria bacterium]
MIGVSTLWLYERRLDLPAFPVALPPEVELAVLDSSPAARETGLAWHAEAEARLEAGQACAIARRGEDIIAYCWLTCAPAWAGEIGRLVVPGPTEVYLYDAFTVPDWRGRALFPALLGRLVTFAHGQGRERALIFVLAGNHASRRAIERAGFEKFAAVSRIGVGPLEHVWFRRPRSGRSRVTLVTSTALTDRQIGPAGDREVRPPR